MKWSFTIPGQPMSLNATYRIVRKQGRRGSFLSLAKTEKVKKWQQDAVYIIRSAKPSGWAPTGQIRVRVRLFLGRSLDSDAPLKALCDAIEMATGIDDERYLVCVLSKESGLPAKEARTEVELEDIGSPFAGVPDSNAIPSPSSTSSRVFQPPRPSSFAHRR
jgi:hypothetical protein